jgi:hypothetical protein
MEKNFSKLMDYQSTLNFLINSDLILIKIDRPTLIKKKKTIQKKFNRGQQRMLLPAITFTTEAIAVSIIQLPSLQCQQQHLVSSPPPQQWGGE